MAVEKYLGTTEAGVVRQVRPPQVEMSLRVEDVFMRPDPKPLFAQAGTGTGKTYAYLVAAILSGLRVVVSTAKKGLQSQIVEIDLPFLMEKVKKVQYELLMGKGNYSCILRVDEMKETEVYKRLPDIEKRHFLKWFSETKTAALSELPQPFIFDHMTRVTECLRMNCPHARSRRCGYDNVRAKASVAKILVVNHALLAHDLALGGGKMFGEYDALIMDEGHQAPKFFRDAYSKRLHMKQLDALNRSFAGTEFDVHEALTNIYGYFFENFAKKEGPIVLSNDSKQTLKDMRKVLGVTWDALGRKGLQPDTEDAPPSDDGDANAGVTAKLKAGASLVKDIRTQCAILLGEHVDLDQDGNPKDVRYVTYIEKNGRDESNALVTTPVDIGPLIAPALMKIKRVVVTSATLAGENKSMNYMMNEFGLTKEQCAEPLIVESPFDYKNRSALYVSKTTPDPGTVKDAAYYAAMAPEIHELLEASQGGALVLCTSYKDMKGLYEAIRARYSPLPYYIATQSGSPEGLIKWFKEQPRAVIFGVKTFWEGVDLPGIGLRLVIVPKIPFPSPFDVVLQARKRTLIDMLIEHHEYPEGRASAEAWGKFDFQEAIIDWCQAAGRLMRSENDVGFVALLDWRASGRNKSYGWKIRQAVPHPVTDNKAMVLNILKGFGAQAVALAGGAPAPEKIDETPPAVADDEFPTV